MTSRRPRANDKPPDLKWVVEYLVQREGQRKTAALLGVNRKTVALALSRERLTDRMALAVHRFMAALVQQAKWTEDYSVSQVSPPHHAARYFRYGGNLRSIHPDSYGVVQTGSQTMPFS